MTSFRAAERRAFWAAYVIGYILDGLAFATIAGVLGAGNNVVWWFLLSPAVIRLVAMIYGLWSFAKRLGWYYLFERETRVNETMAEFTREGFPAPHGYFQDVDEYLSEAALDQAIPEPSRVKAAVTLGILSSQRTFGPRSEALIRSMVIEEALRRLPPREEYQ